jgi:hypothetical protein
MKMQLVFAVLAAAQLAAGCVGLIPATKDDPQKSQGNQTLLDVELAKKANEADVKEALQKLAVSIDKVTEKADNALKNAAATSESVKVLGKSVDTRVAGLEKSLMVVRGVRAPQQTPVGYAAGLEDKPGIDKNKKLLRLSGFPSAKMDRMGVLAACDEISGPMQGLIKEIAVLANSGWDVREIVGFPDDRLSRKLGGVCAGKRAKAIAEALKVSPGLASGRVTTKFGGEDVSRSVLVYLERTTPAAKAATAAKSTAAPAASAQAASAAAGTVK